MIKTVYAWFTEASWRSWYAHALAATAMTYGVVGLYSLLMRLQVVPHVLVYPQSVIALWAATGTLLLYCVREMGDELKHRRAGEWHKRANIDKVSWANDGKGDLVGPVAVWLGALASWLVS